MTFHWKEERRVSGPRSSVIDAACLASGEGGKKGLCGGGLRASSDSNKCE